VDFARRQILVERLPVQLTLREYDLLAKLIERAGEVVARRELTGLTAAASIDGESNAVDVHISRIRDKLGPHGSRIETVRGVGYRLRRS
jgi:DNA-binding response OmpR family regulator